VLCISNMMDVQTYEVYETPVTFNSGSPKRWRQGAPPKRQETSTINGITIQYILHCYHCEVLRCKNMELEAKRLDLTG
jgi:hypothetical protein